MLFRSLKTFIEETTKDKEILQNALQNDAVELISAKAHKLIPLFTLMNATELIQLLAWLERNTPKTMTTDYKNKTQNVLILLTESLLQAENYLNSI